LTFFDKFNIWQEKKSCLLISLLAIVIIIDVANNLVGKYGYMTISSTGSPFGAIIPWTVIGICMEVFGIVVSIVIGFSLGCMSYIGYIMESGNTKRVKENVKYILLYDRPLNAMQNVDFYFFGPSITR